MKRLFCWFFWHVWQVNRWKGTYCIRCNTKWSPIK